MARDGGAGAKRGAVPRVQVSYETDVDGFRQRRELPFVVGVVGDFSAKPDPPLPRLRERKFIEVERGSFDTVMAGARPRLTMLVPNRLRDDSSKLAVELRFTSLDDFEPAAVAAQVAPLQKLAELRAELSSMLRALHEQRKTEGAAAR